MSKLNATVAWLALFFSLAGAGLAASRYIITSTSQIKPSVRQALVAKANGQLAVLTLETLDASERLESVAREVKGLCEAVHTEASVVPSKLTSEALWNVWEMGC